MHITNVFMTHYKMNMLIQVVSDQESIFVSTPQAFLSWLPFQEQQACLELLVIFCFCPPYPLSFAPFCSLYHFCMPILSKSVFLVP